VRKIFPTNRKDGQVAGFSRIMPSRMGGEITSSDDTSYVAEIGKKSLAKAVADIRSQG
jgi:hypothetical protein